MNKLTLPWQLFQKQFPRMVPFPFLNGWARPLRAGPSCKAHAHDFLEIVYHRHGSGLSHLEGEPAIAFREGSIVIYAPCQLHDQVMDDNGEDLCVHIGLPQTWQRRLRGGFTVDRIDPVVIREIEALAEGSAPGEKNRTVHSLRASAVLSALLEAAGADQAESLSPAERHLRRAEDYLRKHFREIGSLREVADDLGISEGHLRHLFRTFRGKSMARQVNELRTAHAQTLLIHSGLEIKDIATQCGFRDVHYFSKVFSEIIGRPPHRYREQIK